ncbi:MAG: ribosomal protein L7/L12 [Bacteroidota bacterium]
MTHYDYLQSYDGYFWDWEDKAEVIAIPNDNTIAYTVYVNDALQKLAPGGLPPFGALLLAIIATNARADKSLEKITQVLFSSLKQTDAHLTDALSVLTLIAQVPTEFKAGKKRILLLQALFEDCHNSVSPKNSADLLTTYFSDKHDPYFLSIKKQFSTANYNKDIRTISLLKKKFTSVKELLHKIAALPGIPEEITLTETTHEEPKDLTDQLVEHAKTFHVGSLVKRIWSGLNIPVHSNLPSQQPLGGVSDLTNKGDFDKLLISEFANEDIVFLSRLANNEALFIHREIPPAANNFERIILIDVSLKTWGTPKAIAFATMLAIARHPKTTIPCSAFVIGHSFTPVSIESVESIISGIEILEGSLHPAKGIDAFFKAYPPDKNREIFLITEPTTLKQAAMAYALNEYQAHITYRIYTDAEGHIDVYKKQQSSIKHIQHLQLPLEELWKKEGLLKSAPRAPRDHNNAMGNYPILFRNSLNLKKYMVTADGETYQLTGDKTLLRLFDKTKKVYERGWEMVLENLPFTPGDAEVGLLANGEHLLLLFNTHNRETLLINLSTHTRTSYTLSDWKSVPYGNFVFRDDAFFHMNHKGCWSIEQSGITELTHAPFERKVFSDRQSELLAIATKLSGVQGVFKNIKEIAVNSEHVLIFNKHALQVNVGGHLKLDPTSKLDKKLNATKHSDTEFIFDDGSSVEINRSGMLILKSSDTTIPYIYIPSLINSSLGAVAANEFAGNEYYYPELQYKVILNHAGNRILPLVKAIKDNIDRGLSDVRQMVVDHELPKHVASFMSLSQATKLKQDIEQEGATAEIHELRSPLEKEGLKKIKPHDFYHSYITSFINQIIAYGTKS